LSFDWSTLKVAISRSYKVSILWYSILVTNIPMRLATYGADEHFDTSLPVQPVLINEHPAPQSALPEVLILLRKRSRVVDI